MRPGAENTPSRSSLSIQRLDAKLDVASERLNSIVQAETLGISGVTAAMILEGAIDGDTFTGFLRQVVVPILHQGDMVVMDNLRAHKVESVEPMITATGAKLQYLPRYSPELSPIEHCWSKMKTLLRTVAARSHDTLIKGVKKALEGVTENDAKGWFRHCGYCT
jgi:transposase